jgi:hypothetical protein
MKRCKSLEFVKKPIQRNGPLSRSLDSSIDELLVRELVRMTNSALVYPDRQIKDVSCAGCQLRFKNGSIVKKTCCGKCLHVSCSKDFLLSRKHRNCFSCLSFPIASPKGSPSLRWSPSLDVELLRLSDESHAEVIKDHSDMKHCPSPQFPNRKSTLILGVLPEITEEVCSIIDWPREWKTLAVAYLVTLSEIIHRFIKYSSTNNDTHSRIRIRS